MLDRFFGNCEGGFFGAGWWIIILFFLFLAFQDCWEDIDICAIINLDRESVSLRCKKGKADCSEIAKRYNGGGHKEASGFTLNKEIKETILKLIF